MVLVDVVRVAIAGREIRAQLFEVAVGRGDADGVWDNHGGGASSLKSLGEFWNLWPILGDRGAFVTEVASMIFQ